MAKKIKRHFSRRRSVRQIQNLAFWKRPLLSGSKWHRKVGYRKEYYSGGFRKNYSLVDPALLASHKRIEKLKHDIKNPPSWRSPLEPKGKK